jgi:eukaryotic-like serine/threonine-protein kinase
VDSGTLIAGRYRLERVIASGGMGSVWRARDERLEREVAVKILHAGLDGTQRPRDRFEREAKTLAGLKGPGWVEVYDFGEEPDGDREVPYLVMELVEGVSLAELLHREERLAPARTMRIVAEAAEALATAHRRGIVHRDVKPGNILIDADDRVRVVDFGISLFAGRSRLTPTDAVLGTAPYVSPEQLRDKDVTGASDLYSLGSVAYECLTGAPPFDAEDPASIIHGHLYSEPPALPEDVPASIAGVVARTLRKSPEERWPSGEALAAACRAATTDEGTVPLGPVAAPFRAPVEPPPQAPAGTPEEGPRRRRRLVLPSIAVAVAVAMLSVLLIWKPWDGDPPASAGEDDATPAAATPTGETSGAPSPSDGPTSGESATESPAAQAEATATEDGGAATDDEGGTDDDGPDSGGEEDAEDRPEEGSGEVPSVLGLTTFEARDELNDHGFTGAVAEVGIWWATPEPAHCTVMQQHPAPGETAAYDATISLSYHRRNAEGTTCEW